MFILQLAYYLLDTQTDTGRRNTPPLPGNYPKLVAAFLRIAEVYLQAWRKVMAAYRRLYDSRHRHADCQEPGSAPEHYAR